MSLGSNSIQWCEAIKYLGVYLQGGIGHLNSTSIPRNVHFMLLATQFSYTALAINELTVLHLQETYSLSVLMYAIPALKTGR